MKKGFITIVSCGVILFLSASGCSFVNMIRTVDLKSLDLTTAYKYQDETTKSISVGMTVAEVIEAWGEPHHIYRLDEWQQQKVGYEYDESWCYTREEEPSFGKDISYRISLKKGKVIKIIENEWTHRLIGPGDL